MSVPKVSGGTVLYGSDSQGYSAHKIKNIKNAPPKSPAPATVSFLNSFAEKVKERKVPQCHSETEKLAEDHSRSLTHTFLP